MIDDNFYNNLPDDPVEAIHTICQAVKGFYANSNEEQDQSHYKDYLKAFGVLKAINETYNMGIAVPSLPTGKDNHLKFLADFSGKLASQLDSVVANNIIKNSQDQYLIKIGRTFSYEFSQGDLNRIQTLVNELRENISNSDLYGENHKERILKKLESLQQELHKKVANLDKFWGLIGEAGVVLGKFGNDAKPLVDRIREIAQITWRTQARAEELPSNTPLPNIEDNAETIE